jgi:hypothetical protein
MSVLVSLVASVVLMEEMSVAVATEVSITLSVRKLPSVVLSLIFELSSLVARVCSDGRKVCSRCHRSIHDFK